MLIIGIEGTELTPREIDWLNDSACAGVILFARNIASKQQVKELTDAIRTAAPRPQLICVDQEGGRVQRLRDGYSALPALQNFETLYASNKQRALELIREHAWLMASEVKASGFDLSFAPVADLAKGNLAIGNRAFSAQPDIVGECVTAYVEGMHDAEMAATLKHFPGHGSVLEDTHFDMAYDSRSFADIEKEDLLPFRVGIDAGADAVMMGHVIYPEVAPEPAGYSPYWIKTILREQMGFKGIVFSDDIGMAAAHGVGGIKSRIDAHLDAGCDVVLVCHPELVEESLLAVRDRELNTMILTGLIGRGFRGWEGLLADSRYQQAVDTVVRNGELA